MSSQYTDSMSRNVHFKSVNPFEVLSSVDVTDGNGKNSSVGSSDSLVSLKDAEVAVSTPVRGQTRAFSHSAGQYQAVLSPHLVRSLSSGNGTWSNNAHGINMHNGTASAPVTPARSISGLLTHEEATYGSPNPRSTPRQHHQPGPRSARKSSTSSARKSSSGTHPRTSNGGGGSSSSSSSSRNESLIGISEGLTVQEFAFRQGQRDQASLSPSAAPSPFRKQFDQLWATFYQMGRQQGGVALSHPQPTTAQEHSNYAWPVLINPYTQSLDAPNGVIDQQWARHVCEAALNCMEALVRGVCKRGSGWEKTVVDVPYPVKEALVQFADLAERYETLQHDAKEALSGGRPFGY